MSNIIINPFVFAGGALEPTLGTLIYFYDASVASSISEAGTGVDQWDDLSGNGYDVTQGTDADRPSNTTDGSNPALLFNGTSDFLRVTGISFSTAQKTQFAVVRAVARTATMSVCQTTNSGTAYRTRCRMTTLDIENQHRSNGSPSLPKLANTDTVIHAWVARHDDATTATAELDDGTTGTDSDTGTVLTTGVGKINIGTTSSGTEFWDGYIMEVGAYEERLSDGNKTTLLNHLKTKWGIT